jgi:hypothetical protein
MEGEGFPYCEPVERVSAGVAEVETAAGERDAGTEGVGEAPDATGVGSKR